MKIEKITYRGITLSAGEYIISIDFYPQAWIWTHGITIEGNGKIVHTYSSVNEVNSLLKIFDRKAQNKNKLFLIMLLINNQSYSIKSRNFKDFILGKCSFSKLLKSVWLSMIIKEYDKKLRNEKKEIVQTLINQKLVKKNNRWAKKILNIEQYVLWAKLFKNKWSFEK